MVRRDGLQPDNCSRNERIPMRLFASLLIALLLTACGSLPMSRSAQSGQVQHPDVFHSYID